MSVEISPRTLVHVESWKAMLDLEEEKAWFIALTLNALDSFCTCRKAMMVKATETPFLVIEA